MSAHTPGPWMFLASVVPGQFVICNEHGPRVDVALTYGFEHTPREANARLIAAAPELLEALQALDADWSSFWPLGPDIPASGDRIASIAPETAEIWRTVRAAIAKATGAQQ